MVAIRMAGGWLLAPLLALAALGAGCGDSSTAATASTTTLGGRSSGATGRATFISCLEAHGVPDSVATQGFVPPAGQGSSASTTPTTGDSRGEYASAFQACRGDLDLKLGGGGFKDSKALKAYLSCLTQHGVTLPSTPPTKGSGGYGPGAPGKLQQIPGLAAAQAACASLRPTFARGPAPLGSTPPTSTSSTTQSG